MGWTKWNQLKLELIAMWEIVKQVRGEAAEAALASINVPYPGSINLKGLIY